MITKKEEKAQLIHDLKFLWNIQQEQNVNRNILNQGIPYGIVFHHSGLTAEERILIENAFQARILNVICATSTLAAGVNLPARRVIFRNPKIAKDILTVARYKQMAGRAGRAGIDEFGESFMLLSSNQEEQSEAIGLISKCLENCTSKLVEVEGKDATNDFIENEKNITTIARLVLDLIASRLCLRSDDIKEVAKFTLFWNVNAKDKNVLKEQFLKIFDKAIQLLLDNKYIEKKISNDIPNVGNIKDENCEYIVTSYGKATYKSTFSLEEASFVLNQLCRTRDEGIILSDDLQICFLMTPIGAGSLISPNWGSYLQIYNKLPPIRQKICKIIGLEDSILFDKAYSRGIQEASSYEEVKKELVAKRFYNALILCDIINEEPIPDICKRYGIYNSSDIQALMTQASMFSNMLRTFCAHFSWSSLEILIRQYTDRLAFGVKYELIELAQIEGMNAQLARLFYTLNIETQTQLAKYSWDQLLQLVRDYVDKNYGSSADKHLLILMGIDPEQKAKSIIKNVKRLLNKKASQYRRIAYEYDQKDYADDYSETEEGAVIFSDSEEDRIDEDY